MGYENIRQGKGYRTDKDGNLWLYDVDLDEFIDIHVTNSSEEEVI